MSEQIFPTSFGQQRLWFLDQVAPGTTAYNLARALRLKGVLDQSALTKALQSVTSRHESLRTVFTSEDDEARQVVLPESRFDLPVSDISALSPEQREEAALRIAGEEASKPFDLSTGPLFRAILVRIGLEDREGHHGVCPSLCRPDGSRLRSLRGSDQERQN